VADHLERFRELYGEQYVIESLIGRGGMAEVYRAMDVKHGRPVAVKLLGPDIGYSLAVDRFMREIEIAARLQHPNILPVFDSGKAGGMLYYIMPFVDGGSLRDRLRSEPHLPTDEVVRIVQEVADALAYAHQRNVVHRDIKPENILFSAGHAVVADFGIARAIGASDSQSLTLAGFGVGTPEYMSPEQVFGESDIDGRSDTYSLACVAFELFAGNPPFTGANATAVIMRKSSMEAPALTTQARTYLQPGVDAVVSRALMRNRDDRPATVQEFARALREATAGESSSLTRTSQPRERVLASIAVLPFVNASGTPENDFLCDGISDELVHALGKVPELRVVARTSSFAFKGSTDDARTIAEKLRVQSLLEGTLRRSGDRLRITTQLVDATTGFQLWSERFDRQVTDVFDVQDEITRSIVSSLKLELMPDEEPDRTANHVAYERYLEARFHWNQRTDTGVRRSLNLLDEAISLDTKYAPAHAAQSSALVTLAIYGQRAPVDVMPKARAAADRALELSPSLAEALTARACVRAMYEWDWGNAEGDFERALLSDPNSSTAHQWYAMNLLVPLGRFNEARGHIKRARAADPISPVVSLGWGLIHYFERDFERAVAAYRELLERTPDFGIAHFFLGQALLEAHRPDEAFSHLQLATAQAGAAPETMAMVGVAHATAGRVTEARASLAALMERSKTSYVSPVLLAQLHSALGDPAATLDALEKARDARATDLVWIGVRPAFDAVRIDPRFEAIVRQIGLSRNTIA
jgi:serine/threonine protein kinase/tetratricopeptide (TPR) repeat protein